MSPPPRPVLLMGPTATGKSMLAAQLAAELGGEVVSVDSCAIYRGLDIGSAKPSAAERGAVPHHLIDIRDPHESYSVGAFFDAAGRLAGEISARGRVPILAGGTMMYFNCLLKGLSQLPPTREDVRESVRARIALEGPERLHAWLAENDSETAARLHPNDSQRVGRAVEVQLSAGRPLSELLRELPRQVPFADGAVAIGMLPSDSRAHNARIARRTRLFAELGWAEEVAGLLRRDGVGPESQSMRSVGYKEMVRHALGEIGLDDALSLAEIATRRLAKRQRTWLRALRGFAAILDPQREDFADEALGLAREAVR